MRKRERETVFEGMADFDTYSYVLAHQLRPCHDDDDDDDDHHHNHLLLPPKLQITCRQRASRRASSGCPGSGLPLRPSMNGSGRS